MRLRCALLTVVGLAWAGMALCAGAELVFTRERFDHMDERIDSLRDIANAGPDEFAWGEGYMLRAYLEMYLATGDADYLRRLVRVADQIIATRDDRRPGSRLRGRPEPVWSVAGKYTVGKLVLRDASGDDAILLRSIRYAYNDQTRVQVSLGPQPGTFDLATSNEFWHKHGNANTTFRALSLDPASPRYFERVINDPRYVASEAFARAAGLDEAPSYLLVALDLRSLRKASPRLASVGPKFLVPQAMPYYGYIGPIYSGMTRFVKLVDDRPDLQPEFGASAQRYLRAARESLAGWEKLWREGPRAGEGYYLLDEKGGNMWCDGIMAPFNYLGSAGQVLLNVWDCTGDRRALDHAGRIARLFKRCCTRMPNGSYSFPYWSPVGAQGWSKRDRLSVNTPQYGPNPVADDMSHGAWQVEFAVMCQQRGIVFTRSDMRRLAWTFTRNIWTGDPEDLALRVDGSGGPAGGNNVAGARWLDLCAFEPDIFSLNRTVWQANGYEKGVYGALTCGYARLYRWQQRLARGSDTG